MFTGHLKTTAIYVGYHISVMIFETSNFEKQTPDLTSLRLNG